MDPITEQPLPKKTMGDRLSGLKHSLTTKEGLVGDFDFKFLCMPQLPFGNASKNRKPSPFYGLDDDLPILVAAVAGFQHALAMIAGLITPPIIFASALNLPIQLQSYMISASLITSGILSAVQMSRIHIWRGYYLGTGLITVVGTSFATLSTAFAVFAAMEADGTCTFTTAADGTRTMDPCPDAYGALIGTTTLAALTEIGLSFVPPARLKKLFPPIITGTVVILIGASLIGESGVLNWGGGSNDCHYRPETGIFELCPTIFAPKPYQWGHPRFIGLGFLSFITIVLTEMFGSPFLRNASIIVGLLVGSIVAAACGYINSSQIDSTPAITFLWVHTFKLRIYGPAILPCMAVYLALALEAIGDITASSEASRVEVDGPVFSSRIQGGILADGLAGMFSGLMTVTPMSIFAQNNGVIILTKCANRKAGRFCAGFLILFGTIGKISGAFLSIPNPVLGGVTSFLFATVAVSGVRVVSYCTFDRKTRFTLAGSLMVGLGNLLVPGWFTYLFEGVSANAGLQGFLNSIVIILSTPFLASAIVGMILWNIIPGENTSDSGIVRDIEAQEEDTHELGSLGKHDDVSSGKPEEYDEVKLGKVSSSRIEPVNL